MAGHLGIDDFTKKNKKEERAREEEEEEKGAGRRKSGSAHSHRNLLWPRVGIECLQSLHLP